MAKQIHITPIAPYENGYPPYLLAPYLDVKAAFNLIMYEDWFRQHAIGSTANGSGYESNREDPLAHDEARPAMSWPQMRTGGSSGIAKVVKLGKDVTPPTERDFFRTITGQLEMLKLGKFSGRQHSGIDVSLG